MDEDFKSEVHQACRISEEFTKYYYQQLDKRRHMMHRLYMDNATLIWNGNGTRGNEEIGKFLMALPMSEHRKYSLDSQEVGGGIIFPNTLAYLIKVTGTVKYQTNVARPFTQTFMIINQSDDRWKIVTDCFRLQYPIL